MINPIYPKKDFLYESFDGICFKVDKLYLNDEIIRTIEISNIVNPKQIRILTVEEFRSSIDFDKYPKLKGKKLWMYNYIG